MELWVELPRERQGPSQEEEEAPPAHRDIRTGQPPTDTIQVGGVAVAMAQAAAATQAPRGVRVLREVREVQTVQGDLDPREALGIQEPLGARGDLEPQAALGIPLAEEEEEQDLPPRLRLPTGMQQQLMIPGYGRFKIYYWPARD